jgi:regulatory protein
MRSRSSRRARASRRGVDDESGFAGSTAGNAGGAEADPEQVARAIVLRQLTGQPRSRAELAKALDRRGVADEVIERVLGRFSEVGLIDDNAFARAWVESRHAGRGLARRALAHELRRRGVGDDDVGEAVDLLSPETEQATARALVLKRLPSTRGADARTRIRRLVSMLSRKGYPPGLAVRIVREALADEAGDERAKDDERAAVEEFAAAAEAVDNGVDLDDPGRTGERL